MTAPIPYNWSDARSTLQRARFPERGRPLEGSKNLRLVQIAGQATENDAVYAIRYHSSYIGIYRREIYKPIWSLCGWDSISTKRHVNSISDINVYSHRDLMFAGGYDDDRRCIIDTGRYYFSNHDSVCELEGWSADVAKELKPVNRIPVHRPVPLKRNIMLDPKAGDMFSIGDATYIWVWCRWLTQFKATHRMDQEIMVMRYHGTAKHGLASWSDDNYGYLAYEPGMSDLGPKSILWLATAAKLIDDGAKPAKPFDGDPYTGRTINFGVTEDTTNSGA